MSIGIETANEAPLERKEAMIRFARFSLGCLSLVILSESCIVAGEPKKPAEPGMGKVELVAQILHTGAIRSVAFSPDGKQVLTGGDNTAVLWDAATGRQLRTFHEHVSGGAVASVAFSPDGRQVVLGKTVGSTTGGVSIWDADTAKKLHTFDAGTTIVSVAFSSDGTQVLSGCEQDKTVVLWDAGTGRKLRTFEGHDDYLTSVAFSPDGKQVLTGSRDKTALLWDASTGRKLRGLNGHDGGVYSLAFSRDGTQVLTGSSDKTAALWDSTTGQKLHTFHGHAGGISSVAFSPDGKQVLTGSWDKTAARWDVTTGQKLQTFQGHVDSVKSVAFSPDGKQVLTGSSDKTATLWDVTTGQNLRTFQGYGNPVNTVGFSRDGKQLGTGAQDATAALWDAVAGQNLRTLKGHGGEVSSLVFSPDGMQVLTGSSDKTAVLWDLTTGQKLQTFKGHKGGITSVAFSPDGKHALTGSVDETAALWDAGTAQKLRAFHVDAFLNASISSVAFSPDGKKVLTGNSVTVVLWDTGTGKKLHAKGFQRGSKIIALFSPDGKQVFTGSPPRMWGASGLELRGVHFVNNTSPSSSAAFSPDSKQILTGHYDMTSVLCDASTGERLRTYQGHLGVVTSVAFSPNGKVLTGSADATTRLWDLASGKELCKLISFRDGTWAVVDSDGRFDASSAGDVAGLHWVSGLQPIALSQLKERYYEPGLLTKYMGFNKEPLRTVRAFKDVSLYPEAKVAAPSKDNKLTLDLSNAGGGIGKVQVFVNGRELVADARDSKVDAKADKATLTVDLTKAPTLKPGEANKVEVVTWNAEGYLSSRGITRQWTPEGAKSTADPELYAIVAGVSEYANTSLNLRYAAKDAEDIAKALDLGAKKFFGTQKVHLDLLVTSNAPGAKPPTKANLQAAFEHARKAKPGDVVVIYLAGHGVSLKSGSDEYCYLTKDARTVDVAALSDPALLGQYAVTSTELTEWVKQIPALKQVLILDTCAAGAAAKSLTEQRSVNGDQIRAIERLKDRTGFHVLMGCAADKVSYEATQYSQGLLTHALLKAMRGAALRQDEYVDVAGLFQYAADEVPQLAKNIGGIQKPLIAAPRGSSFDIGRLTVDEKKLVPLASPRPILLRPLLLNPDEGDDNLALMPRLRQALADATIERGGKATAAFVDAEEMPGAFRPAGTYTVMGDKIQVRLNLRQDGKTLATVTVQESRMNLDRVVQTLVQGILKEVGKR